MTSGRSNQATWWPMALVAISSLALMALATLWVTGHHPRAANPVPTPVQAAEAGPNQAPAQPQWQVLHAGS